MTPPRWLLEQRRAQATMDRNLTQLPIALDEINHRVVRLQLGLARLRESSDKGPLPSGPVSVRWAP